MKTKKLNKKTIDVPVKELQKVFKELDQTKELWHEADNKIVLATMVLYDKVMITHTKECLEYQQQHPNSVTCNCHASGIRLVLKDFGFTQEQIDKLANS